MAQVKIGAFYRFSEIQEPLQLQEFAKSLGEECDLVGTMLIAREGVNGTLAGSPERLDKFFGELLTRIGKMEVKFSTAPAKPFRKFKVRIKKEIVTFRQESAVPTNQVGTYVKPKDWNDLISDPDVVLIDTRNDYEVGVGTFKGAVDPNTTSFREFPDWFRKFNEENKPKKVAMFCTGGIRCEKATNFVKSEGIEDVYHLQGGILKYFEDVGADESLWEGECFVFDNRVTVDQDLHPGSYDMCHACKWPITDEEKQHPHFEAGVSCPRCHGLISDAQRSRFQERQHQMKLARERGTKHIGRKEKA